MGLAVPLIVIAPNAPNPMPIVGRGCQGPT
jgi:hypothetical protein